MLRRPMARILVVDDDERVRELLRAQLERGGHEVREAADGLAVLAAYRSFTPDLVLLDMFMPRRDGLEAIRELRGEFPQARVVAMSGGGAYSDFEPLRAAIAFGAAAALVKPIAPEELRRAIEQVLAT
jgi:CheY-like chemotaxis protein